MIDRSDKLSHSQRRMLDMVDGNKGECRIKCCGMFRESDIEAVNAAAPDMCGFIVDFPKSHRSITADQLRKLRSLLDDGICAVGVFVDADIRTIVRLADEGLIDAAQLHGSEDADYVRKLKEATPVTVIQAFRVRTEKDVAAAQASPAHLVLLDNGQGTGTAFDWSIVRNVGRSFILAGGLNPDNIADAIAHVHPWGIDLSSGLETNRLKDPKKIFAATQAVRSISI